MSGRREVVGGKGEEGNGVMMAGPERGAAIDEGIGMALELGAWNMVTLTMENSQPLQPHTKRNKIWHYETYLIIGNAMRPHDDPESDSREGKVKIGDVSWDDATLCISKAPGILFSDMFFFSKALEPHELRHLGNTIVTNKPERDEYNGVQKWRA